MVMLFCNIGWMEHYQGLHSGAQISGGGSFVTANKRGHEVCNFSPYKGCLYGYVQPPGMHINIDRIGANSNAESIDGITIVWTATTPNGGTVIVGWYKDAEVFRSYQKFSKVPPMQSQNGIDGYWVKAPFSQATLLPIDHRVFEIPRGVKGGIGKSNIWYADSVESSKLIKQVKNYISAGGIAKKTRKSKARTAQDQEKKSKVEKIAIRTCCDHYEALGYEVVSVEKDNLGWDLIAKCKRTSLRIEVKGLSGDKFYIELTPNEYEVFKQQADDYRLAVVVNSLVSPSLSICRYSNEQGTWIVEGEDGRSLDIKTKQSASIKCL